MSLNSNTENSDRPATATGGAKFVLRHWQR